MCDAFLRRDHPRGRFDDEKVRNFLSRIPRRRKCLLERAVERKIEKHLSYSKIIDSTFKTPRGNQKRMELRLKSPVVFEMP
jgi:hypothetical protein